MDVIVMVAVIAAPIVFLRACWQISRSRKEDRVIRAWFHDREVYRRERNR